MYASQREEQTEDTQAQEFPILCETCLGDNPYVRMTKEPFGKACKICERPFNIFRWKAGANGRFKKTEVCTTCAKLKNVCQTCILDLQYGVPVQVRDSVLEQHERINFADHEVNRGVQIEQLEKKLAAGTASLPYDKVSGHAILEKLARRKPYYKRNEAHICSFFVRGECNRGDACPFRHEMPPTGDLASQNIKDRFHGHNDPVANRMLRRANDSSSDTPLPPPADINITTLWIGGVDNSVTDQELREKFYQYGAITNIKLVPLKNSAFVTFANRKAAEDAAASGRSFYVRGLRLVVGWSKSFESGSMAPSAAPKSAPPGLSAMAHQYYSIPAASAASAASVSDAPLGRPLPPPPVAVLPPPPGMDSGMFYPSMQSHARESKLPLGGQQ